MTKVVFIRSGIMSYNEPPVSPFTLFINNSKHSVKSVRSWGKERNLCPSCRRALFAQSTTQWDSVHYIARLSSPLPGLLCKRMCWSHNSPGRRRKVVNISTESLKHRPFNPETNHNMVRPSYPHFCLLCKRMCGSCNSPGSRQKVTNISTESWTPGRSTHSQSF